MKLLTLIYSIFSVALLYAQGSAYVRKQNIKLGEPTELVYEFTYGENDGKINYQPQQNEISCSLQQGKGKVSENNKVSLEILAPFKDTLLKKGSKMLWQGTYKITAWDTGRFMIPITGVFWKDSLFELPSVMLSVSATKLVEGKDIYGIKEKFIEIPLFSGQWFKENWLWLSVIIVVICTALIFYLRKNRTKKQGPVNELSLKDKSILALEALKQAKLWQIEQLKEHYFELSYLLRSYLSSRYELNLLETTSQQATLLLAQKGLAVDTIQTIKHILSYADMAKFAKSIPGELEILRNLAQVKQIIIETSPIEIAHVE